MNPQTRSVKKYSFKKPDLTRLRELGSQVTNPIDFRDRHGRLLDLLKVKVEDGIMETLVQFYDPTYHCFTFADYQLVPTLEEYSDWVGLLVSEREPFNGLEPATIAAALHLKPSDIVHPHFAIKNNFQGLTTKFLYQKASDFAKAKMTDAFESVIALLIYGLFLFSNMDNYINLNAIKIFLTKNTIPTLLADTYYSIHQRNSKGDGTIVCCAPLLYKWYASHLPKSVFSKANTEKALWSQRIMPLTPPNNFSLSLSGEFYLNIKVHVNMRMRFVQAWHSIRKFVQAWHSIRKFDGNQLGKNKSFAHEFYTQWVIDRAMTFGMPYTLPRFLSTTTPEIPLPLPLNTMEEFQVCLADEEHEKFMCKGEYQKKDQENDTVICLDLDFFLVFLSTQIDDFYLFLMRLNCLSFLFQHPFNLIRNLLVLLYHSLVNRDFKVGRKHGVTLFNGTGYRRRNVYHNLVAAGSSRCHKDRCHTFRCIVCNSIGLWRIMDESGTVE
ncbi:hypothetical protein MTR_4g049270 [Medicago truncatula]|uniref:DUF7745 domain-containing protein n=1 Tax=Medicago truncatula TaxID=3880 RepID=G7JDK3_MEDTR|nr:hypothetical protein MTR_4g049270 [Medicago truncatula]